jgi:GGDEF domain-containing protein
MAIKKASESNRSIFILMLKIENMTEFRKKRPPQVVDHFLRELYNAVRMAVHPSQYVGYHPDGLGLVFDAVDPGKADTIAKRLISLTQHVIRTGRYNDLTSRWTDILQQFLWPNNPGLLFPRIGWAIYPRDAESASALLSRARAHVAELAR